MTTIFTYVLRAASVASLHEQLVEIGEGRARRFAWAGEDESLRFDEARVRLPYPETAAGEPEPTGFWLCDVSLVDEEDAMLAAIAVNVVESPQAAIG
jgi:hypothetical protein